MRIKELLGEQGNGTLQGMLGEGTDKVLESKIQAEVAELMCPCHATAQVRKIISNAIQQNRNACRDHVLCSTAAAVKPPCEAGLNMHPWQQLPACQCKATSSRPAASPSCYVQYSHGYADLMLYAGKCKAPLARGESAKEVVALLPPQLHDRDGYYFRDQHRQGPKGRS